MLETQVAANYTDPKPLGEGGMGTVIELTDLRLDRRVAMKSLRTELAKDEDFRQRFMQEARCAGQLEHPGMPPVYELGTDPEGQPFFTMKLIQGETLGQIIERLRKGDSEAHKDYSFERRLQIGLKVCEALTYAHHKGWLHRDVKPDNIMVGSYGEVYLTDWGIAVRKGSPELTEEVNALGTPGYCPVEQMSTPNEIDERADVFALGATLYELFTLRPSFSGKTGPAIIMAMMEDPAPPADTISAPDQGRVPREISRVLSKCLEKDRNLRYPTMKALENAIQDVINGEYPVVCVCTASKRGLEMLQEFIDNGRGLAASLIIFWTIAPFLMLAWMMLTRF